MEERRAWYEQHEPYLYWDGGRVGSEYAGKAYFRLEGKYRIDEDARALGIANNDPAPAGARRSPGPARRRGSPERAQRLLARYGGADHDSADDWQGWLDENEGSLFASDWAGYRFQPAGGPGEADVRGSSRFAVDGDELENLAVTVSPAVEVTMSTAADGDGARAILDFRLEPGFWIYAPDSGRGVRVRRPRAIRLRLAGRGRPRPAQGRPGGPDTRRLPDRGAARRRRRRGDAADRLPGM